MKSLDQLKSQLLANPQTRPGCDSLAGELKNAQELIPTGSLGGPTHSVVTERMGKTERKVAGRESTELASPALMVTAERNRGVVEDGYNLALEGLDEPALEAPREYSEAWGLWCELDAIQSQVETLEKMEPTSITEVCERRDELRRLYAERKRLQDALASLKPATTESTDVQASGSVSKEQLLDLSLLATREQLIEAFGSFTGMNLTWFDNITHKPALFRARKVIGRGGAGKSTEPMFCPFEVMLWLVNPKRRNTPGRESRARKRHGSFWKRTFPRFMPLTPLLIRAAQPDRGKTTH